MIGQNQIIELRKRRMRPTTIFIDAGIDAQIARFDFEKPEHAIAHKLFPTVTIPEIELLGYIDLRFVAACRVIVNGVKWTDSMLTLLERLVDSKASQIVATCISESQEIMVFENANWTSYA